MNFTKLVRKAVVKLLDEPDSVIKIGNKDLEASLGMPVFRNEQVLSGTGVITGLAWTSMGGATLPIEATCIHTLNRGFKLTGQLGEVMKESLRDDNNATLDRVASELEARCQHRGIELHRSIVEVFTTLNVLRHLDPETVLQRHEALQEDLEKLRHLDFQLHHEDQQPKLGY
ncbi:S16 family serine protease [Acidovorax sp. BLS4]|uniref:S16 family serine protease n=1 Tax=Acidovorax sp. BLS4 TaxID=3273430 RepID=UPI00294256D5|nr:S16 family serine protease [Paracidovorax avenae]WOI45592.1 S16 family serine protease [Paracidovorax avenae]